MLILKIGLVMIVSFSNYWPGWGGPNGSPTGRVSSGTPWQEWKYIGAACPPEWPFQTEIIVNGESWFCVDRGPYVTHNSITGAPIIDFLTDKPEYRFREHIKVVVIFPDSPDITFTGQHIPN